MRVGIVGGPMAGMEIRLVDWEEGNYRITDKVGSWLITQLLNVLKSCQKG